MTYVLTPSPVVQRAPGTLALTLAVDPDNIVEGDLHLESGQLHFWDGDEQRLQSMVTLLRFDLGEWFLNSAEGVPWFEQVLVHNPNMRAVREILRRVLLLTPGALEVTRLELTRNRVKRTLAVDFDVRFADRVLSSADFQPFIVRTP